MVSEGVDLLKTTVLGVIYLYNVVCSVFCFIRYCRSSLLLISLNKSSLADNRYDDVQESFRRHKSSLNHDDTLIN